MYFKWSFVGSINVKKKYKDRIVKIKLERRCGFEREFAVGCGVGLSLVVFVGKGFGRCLER